MNNLTTNRAVRRAVERASRDRDGSFSVYTNSLQTVMCDSNAAPPEGLTLHCIAQFWSEDTSGITVQIRYPGGRSEFRKL